MAFKNGLSERLDELRFPSPRSPPSETPFPGYSSLSPGHSSFVSAFPRPTGEVRANLQRRFTTDASKLSSWNYVNNVGPAPPPQVPDALDLLSSVSSVPQISSVPHTPPCRFTYLCDLPHARARRPHIPLSGLLSTIELHPLFILFTASYCHQFTLGVTLQTPLFVSLISSFFPHILIILLLFAFTILNT
jgi:hypothetical protein